MCDFNKILTNHLNELNEQPYSRNLAWHLCYKFISSNYEKILAESITNGNEQQNTIDFAALNLAYYLINWGMGRDTVISQYNFRIYRSLIVDLLRKCNLRQELNQENLDIAQKIIDKWYKNLIKSKDESKKDNKPWTSLSTLILMGIFGIVPAYTKNFIKGLKQKKETKNLTEPNFLNIQALRHFKIKEKINNTDLISKWGYTDEKMIDTCFYELGKQNKE